MPLPPISTYSDTDSLRLDAVEQAVLNTASSMTADALSKKIEADSAILLDDDGFTSYLRCSVLLRKRKVHQKGLSLTLPRSPYQLV